MNKTKKYTEILIFILMALIAIEFFGILPEDLKFIINLLSWITFGYIFYKLSPTKIILGNKCRLYDFLIVISYSFMISSDIIGLILTLDYGQSLLFSKIIYFLSLEYVYTALELWLFRLGGLILITSAYLLSKMKHEEKSLLNLLFGTAIKTKTKIFLAHFFILTGLFVTYFSFIAEWFSLAMDSALTLLCLIIGIYVVWNKKYGLFRKIEIVSKIGESVKRFFEEDLCSFFHEKNKVGYVFSGIIVLHMFSEFFSYIIPFISGETHSLYGHQNANLASFLIIDISVHNNYLAIAWTYLSILCIILLFLLLPSAIWYANLKKRGISINRVLLSFYYSMLLVYLAKSFISMMSIKAGDVAGVVFLFEKPASFYFGLDYIMILSLAAFLFVLIFSEHRRIRWYYTLLGVMPVLLFCVKYVWYFAASIISYYLRNIGLLFNYNYYFILLFMLAFLIVSLLFYIYGFFFFFLNVFEEMKREHNYIIEQKD